MPPEAHHKGGNMNSVFHRLNFARAYGKTQPYIDNPE
jgi:hypothetical protein